MPKPTFFQAVFNKPSRSYANPNGLSSLWSDDYDYHPSRSTLSLEPSRSHRQGAASTLPSVVYNNRQRSNAHEMSSRRGYGGIGLEEQTEFGKRGTVSGKEVISSSSPPSTSSSRLSSVTARKTLAVKEDSSRSTLHAPRHLTTPSPDEEPVAPVRRKTKKKTTTSLVHDDSYSITSSSHQPGIINKSSRPKNKEASDASSLKLRANYIEERGHRVVSESPPIPSKTLRPVENSITQPVALLTPPQSEMAVETKASSPLDFNLGPIVPRSPNSVVTKSPEEMKPTNITQTKIHEEVAGEDDSDEDVSNTSQNSSCGSIVDNATKLNVEEAPTLVNHLAPVPLFNLQPPTPAPIADPVESPFQSQPTSSPASSLSPPNDSPPIVPPKTKLLSFSTPDGVHTVIREDGSGAEQRILNPRKNEGSQSRQTSFTASDNRSSSRSPGTTSNTRTESVAGNDGNGQVATRSSSRQSSRKGSRNSFDDFVVHRRPSIAPSDASGGGGYATSVRSQSNGYGKGGWAAAAATKSITPVMFMPTDGGDGWSSFQPSVPAPPRRQSRFTPLPVSSLPPTFDRLVNGLGAGGSDTGSSNSFNKAGLCVPSVASSPSEYSQTSELKPSRSYIKGGDPNQIQYAIDDRIESERQSSSTADMMDNGWSSQSRLPPPPPPPPPPHSYSDEPQRIRTMLPRPASAMSRLENRALSPPTSPRSTSSFGTVPRPMSPYDEAVHALADRVGLERPSVLNPDTLTFLPVMTEHDSNSLYRPMSRSRTVTNTNRQSQDTSNFSRTRRPRSVLGSIYKYARSDVSGGGRENEEDDPSIRRSKSAMGHHSFPAGPSHWDSGSVGTGVLMESHGRDEHTSGYTNLILPQGAYNPVKPSKSVSELNPHVLGLPHSAMASICLSTSFRQSSSSPTPIHLRRQMGPPVDFSSHIKPPTKVGSSQILVQVYAVAIDWADVQALEEKGKSDVGKWVPGRSFVGRCLAVGVEEKDIVRGDLVIGLVDVRKSGALSEYILCDRRRLARAPFPTELSLEQLSLLPLQGITALRIVQSRLIRGSRALIMDAHTGIAALVCQAMSRAGVHVTAVIPGGDHHLQTQTMCMANGAKGVLTGSAAAIMLSLEEDTFSFVLDTQGGQKVYNAARRVLNEGGRLVSLCRPEPTMVTAPVITQKPTGGLKSLRAAFASRRKDSKFISFEYIEPAGSGEPEVDSTGLDRRDVLEESGMSTFRPILDNGIGGGSEVVSFEKGAEAFKGFYDSVLGASGTMGLPGGVKSIQKVAVIRLLG